MFELLRSDLREVLILRIDRSGGPESCHLYQGLKTKNGYGRICVGGGKEALAHRVVFFLETGEQPPEVIHSCDNPPCCNFLHLLSGTHSSNMADMWAKGRGASGERSRSRLSASQVTEIKRLLAQGEPASVIAPQFGVLPSLVYNIKCGRSWRLHV